MLNHMVSTCEFKGGVNTIQDENTFQQVIFWFTAHEVMGFHTWHHGLHFLYMNSQYSVHKFPLENACFNLKVDLIYCTLKHEFLYVKLHVSVTVMNPYDMCQTGLKLVPSLPGEPLVW